MSEYTPTTDEVREAIAEWAWSRRMFRPELGQSDGREADRWFAAHDGEVVSTALTEVWREYASGSFSDSLALLILDDPTEQDVAAWLAQYTAEKRAEWEAEQGSRRVFAAAYRAPNGRVISIGGETVVQEHAQKTVDEFAREGDEGPAYFLASRIVPQWAPVNEDATTDRETAWTGAPQHPDSKRLERMTTDHENGSRDDG